MSGILIKTGLYGLLRLLTFDRPPAAWVGLTLAGLGLLTAFVGIAMALQQRDIKRVLAYSSIENMGLIAFSMGLGLWGMAQRLPEVALLGMTGALLHIWNHALMKGLLFLSAGSILHGTGTKDMERLGGLLRLMPLTGGTMILGSVALAALPPMNGFVSKWLMYMSLMKYSVATETAGSLMAHFGVGLLALIGGLSVVTFVRLTGIVLLGAPRDKTVTHVHESSMWMIGPMLLLALLCLVMAVIPLWTAGLFGGVLQQILGWDGMQFSPDLEGPSASLEIAGSINAWTLLAVLTLTAVLWARTRRFVGPQASTWGCGYVRPTVRMQYTGRSFVEMIAEHLLPRFLRPRTRREPPDGLFPEGKAAFESQSPDPVDQKVYAPFFCYWADRFSRLRILQQGKVHVYLLYIMFMVVLALAWASIRTWFWGVS
jgi:NADH:ubiquinone oxidoreductase subunit 5 (subunit L)/multisubunit Na+/H+ antiporter MnhA subunit